ncbi:leukocidin family pore-forming toxin [Clostridium perfringens]|nr:leukocidin family pore-forming toxin [Clostridium perfringens]
MTGDFSPNFGVGLIAPNGTKKPQIEVSLKREINLYHIPWDTEWKGRNYPDTTIQEKVRFELDWEKHTIRQIS